MGKTQREKTIENQAWAPGRIEDVLEEIKKKILDAPLDYIGDMFSDAAKWLEDVGKGAIKFIDNTGKEIGRTLNKTFAVAEGELTKLMKDAGRSDEDIAHALGTGYKKGAKRRPSTSRQRMLRNS